MSTRSKAAVAFDDLVARSRSEWMRPCADERDRRTCESPTCVVWSALNPKPKKRVAQKLTKDNCTCNAVRDDPQCKWSGHAKRAAPKRKAKVECPFSPGGIHILDIANPCNAGAGRCVYCGAST